MTDGSDRGSVIVPWQALSDSALRGVLEAFVLREGTDYGAREFTLEEKVSHVLAQLRRGEAEIVFEDRTGSVDIVPARRSREPASTPP